MIAKTRISFFLPAGLMKDVKQQMKSEGYDLKKKSKWISEAVERLLSTPGYPDFVKINDEMNGFEVMDAVTVAKELKVKLDRAIVDIRIQYPTIEGVQSRILRTAIVQRLLRC